MAEERNEPAKPDTDSGNPATPGSDRGTTPARPGRRGRLRWPLLILGPLLVIAVASYFYVNSGRIVTTDNAYVKADTVPVSSAVAGIIVRVAVEENQTVKAGDLLFVVDRESYELARDLAQAQLETVSSFVDSIEASYRGTLAQEQLAQTEIDYAERDVEREKALTDRGLGSESDLDQAQHRLDSARQQLPVLEQRLAQIRAQLGGSIHGPIESHPAYRMAKAALDNAETALARTVTRAPFDGVVSHVPLAGAYAAPGSPVLSLVSTEDLWIEANFKETQLTHVAIGQPVVLRLDTYKSDELAAHVESISPATGAEFSVIPAQNASGNWVKVAQRIPVRIRLDDPDPGIRLRAGMSAAVKIDTGYEQKVPGFLAFLQRRPDF